MAFSRQAVASTSKLVKRSAPRNLKTLCPACYPGAPPYSTILRRAQSSDATATRQHIVDPIPVIHPPERVNAQAAVLPNAQEDLSKSNCRDEPAADLEASSPVASPTLEDFYALCPENIRMPRDVDSTETPEFAVYERRYGEMISSLEKAFKRSQVVEFAKAIDLGRGTWKRAGKREIIRRIVAEKVGYTDPAVFKTAEQKRIKAAGKAMAKVTDEIAINETELFFLLGKLADYSESQGTTLLQKLTAKHAVKAAIKGSPPDSVEIYGEPDNIEKFKKDWDNVKGEITSVELDTGSKDGLRSDLYKPLSIATDAFISAGSKKRTVNLTYRDVKSSTPSAAQKPTVRVQRMLAVLSKHTAIQETTPRSILSASIGADQDHALLPYLPREQPPWYLVALPAFGLSRLSYMMNGTVEDPASVDMMADDREYRALAKSEDPKTYFRKVFGEANDVTLRAEFGHHLFINPAASRADIKVDQPNRLVEDLSRSLTTFLPSAPDGLGALLGGWMPPNVQSAVQLSSTYIRRVLYLPVDGKASSAFIKLERPMPGPKELARTPEEMASDRWTAVQGKRALADVFVPDASTDYRLVASTEADATEGILELFTDIVRGDVPDLLTVGEIDYQLYQDTYVRRTVVDGGLDVPWADPEAHQIAFERRSDRIHQLVKSVAVEVTCKAGLKGIDGMMEQLKELRLATSDAVRTAATARG